MRRRIIPTMTSPPGSEDAIKKGDTEWRMKVSVFIRKKGSGITRYVLNHIPSCPHLL